MYKQELCKRVAAVVCAASVAVAASVPGVVPGLSGSQAFADTDTVIGKKDGAKFTFIPDEKGTGARLILGLGGRSFGQLYWLDYSGMKKGHGVNDTDGPIGEARGGNLVPMKFVVPMKGAGGTDGKLTINLSMTFDGAKPVLRHPLSAPDETVKVQFQPMGTRRWGAFGAHTTNKDLQGTKDPFKNNYRLPEDAEPGLGYPDAVPDGNKWAELGDKVTIQDNSMADGTIYNTTVRYTDIKVTTDGQGAPEYAVVFADMEATDVPGIESYDVSVGDSAKYPLVRFGDLYTDEANHGYRKTNHGDDKTNHGDDKTNPWPQYNANLQPCVDNNNKPIKEGRTIKCKAIAADSKNGPGGVMFSARQAKQLSFTMRGQRANAYGIGFLLPYSDGTVEVKNGSGDTAVPTDKQSNFNLSVKVGEADQGTKVVTTQSDKPVHVTNNHFIETTDGTGVVTYFSQATADNLVNGVYTPKWTCRKNSIDNKGNNATAELVDVKDLHLTTIDKDKKISSKVTVPVDDSTTSVSCAVVWTGKVDPAKTPPTTTTTVTTTATTTAPPSTETVTVTPTPVTEVTTVTGTPPTSDNPGDSTPDKGKTTTSSMPDEPSSETTSPSSSTETTTPSSGTSTENEPTPTGVVVTETTTVTTTVTPPAETTTVTEPTPTTTVTSYVTPPTTSESETTSPSEPTSPVSPTTSYPYQPTTTVTLPPTETEPPTMSTPVTVTSTPNTDTPSTPSTTTPEIVPPTGNNPKPGEPTNPSGSVDTNIIIPALVGAGVIGVVTLLTQPVPPAPAPAPAPAVVPAPAPVPEKPVQLAMTGADVNGLGTIAVLMLLAGAWIVVRRRKLS